MRYINKIEKAAAKHLAMLQIMPDGVHAFMPSYVPWEVVPIVGLAGLEVSDERADGVRVFTSKLTATLADSPMADAEPMAWLLTQVDGSKLLLGCAERPMAIATTTDTRPCCREMRLHPNGECRACSFFACLKP